jgi:hypothetical protein
LPQPGARHRFAAAMAALLAVQRAAEPTGPAVIAPSGARFDGAPVRDQHGQQIGVYRRRAGRLVAVLFKQ